MFNRGYGAPGARQFRESSTETEINIPKAAARFVLIGGEILMAVAVGLLLLFHDWAFPLSAGLLMLGALILVARWLRLDTGFAVLFVAITFILLGTLALALVSRAWGYLATGFVALGLAIQNFITPLLQPLPILAALFVWAGLGKWLGLRGAAMVVAVLAGGYAIALHRPTTDFAIALLHLRWLLLPFTLPVILYGFVLALPMIKEAFLPAFEHALQNLTFEDYIKAGGRPWHLWFPRRPTALAAAPRPMEDINVTLYQPQAAPAQSREPVQGAAQAVQDRKGPIMIRSRIPRPDHLVHFASYCLDLLAGIATFARDDNTTQTGARSYGYKARQWPELADAFVKLGFAAKDGRGYNLTPAGLGYLAGVVGRYYGMDQVPAKYAQYVGKPTPLLGPRTDLDAKQGG